MTVVDLLTFTSCGLHYRYSLDESLHNEIEYVFEENDSSYIIFQDNKYVLVGTTSFFHVHTYKVDSSYYLSYDDTLLSWNGNRYIGYIDEYYSDTAIAPIFIYNKRLGNVYFREDYNYLTDTFVIESTGEEIVFENMFTSKLDYFEFDNSIRVDISSTQFPRIEARVDLVNFDERWYLSFPDSDDMWVASEEFIKVLSEKKIISHQN